MTFKQGKLLYTLACFCLFFPAYSVAKKIILTSDFANLRIDKPHFIEHLSHQTINKVVEDKAGYLWIATNDGLNQFDGYSNNVFLTTAPNGEKSSNNEITELFIDHKSQLWVGSSTGLNTYNKEKGKIESFQLANATPIYIDEIFEDTFNQLWVGTAYEGVYFISQDRLTIKKIKTSSSISNAKRVVYSDIKETSNGDILIASNIGLLIYNIKTNQLEKISAQFKENQKELSKNINVLHIIDDSSVLIGTINGAYLINIRNKTLQPFFKNHLNEKTITSIFKEENKLYIGTRKSGFFLITDNTQIKQFVNETDKAHTLINNQVSDISNDLSGNIWISTNVGANFINKKNQLFSHLNTKSTTSQCLNGNTLYSIMLDFQKYLWLPTYGQGLSKINIKEKSCTKINSDIIGLPEEALNTISLIKEDTQKNIWIGTGKGTYLVEKNSKPVSKKLPLNTGNISSLHEHSDNIWLGGYTSGLFKYSKKTKAITKLLPSKSIKESENIFSISDIKKTKEDELLIATSYNGLWVIDLENDRIYKSTVKGVPNFLNALHIDKNKNLWIGTNGLGIVKYSLEQEKKIKDYNIKDGLLSNVILNIVEDGSNNLWFFTEKGLSKLDVKKDKIYTFLEEDGLQADAFTPAGFYDKESNTIWTGGINGINWFNPDEISTTDEIPQVVLTDFELFYKPVELSNEKRKTPLNKVIAHTQKLNLDYTENVFAFTFSAMRFLHAEKIKYQFMLEGYDEDWNQVNADRRYANYTNIAPGNYTFKVKASNRFGEWGESETRLPIYIASPWWQTPYAYISYIILSLLCIYFIIYYRTRLLIKRSEILENQVKTRTEELSQEKSKVERLLDKKNEEFANVSHEFRTPLTLILGPLKKLLLKSNSPEDSKRLETIQKNGFRLLRMVDQLLHLETFKLKSITQQRPIAVGKIIQVLTEAFKDVAKEKNIVIQQNKTLDVTFRFTPDAIEKITLNLLSNAIKYTPSGGSIAVSTERTNNNELKLSVSDTGIGIPHNKLDSVFERYSRVLDKNSEKVTGAGIGLALVKELVETHSGHIKISSELNQGTTIEIYFPIIDEITVSSEELYLNDEAISMEVMNISSHNQTQNISSHESTLSKNNNASTELIVDSFDNYIKTILIIEDHADMRDYIQESITSDFNFLLANNGKDGVKQAQEYIPDLIISDIMMPGMDGYEVTRTLRSQDTTNHIPIILLTARGDRESRLKGWHEQADEYLTKPFDDEELNIRINNLLSIRNILKKRFSQEIFSSPALIKDTASSALEAPDLDSQYSIQQKEFIDKLNSAIDKLYQESTLSIATIAKAIAMSERQFFRKLKSILDMSPTEYLRRYRLEKATYLLKQGKSASFTAFEVGFSSQSYFGKCFKAQFDISPAQYQKDFSD